MSNYENLSFEMKDDVAILAIQRPAVLNALNQKTLVELDAAISAIPATARVLVITGAGEKAFVAGADIAEMSSMTPERALVFARLGHDVFSKLERLEIPVIAAVNGFALGGGCELVLACDFAIASDRARFGQPEVGLGVTPGFGGTVRLGRRVGAARARQLLFSGEHVGAEEALRIGLVNEVVPAAELLDRVHTLARRIAKNAPRAVALAKRSARIAEETDLGTANAFEQQAFALTFSTEDQREGMRAFLEKRAPNWVGR